MKSAIFSTVFALAIAVASASDTPIVATPPQCAVECAIPYVGATGCAFTDTACLCGNQAFAQAVGPCIVARCTNPDDLKNAQSMCNLAVSSPTTSTVHSGSATVSTTHTATSTASGSIQPTTISTCSGTCTSSSSVVVHISTTIHTSGFMNSTSTAIGSGNSTKVSTKVTVVGNLTRTSTGDGTSTTDGTSSSSSSETGSSTITTDTSSSGSSSTSPAASSSSGGAVRLAGSGVFAAAMGMAFFVL